MVRLSHLYDNVLQQWGQAIGETIRNNLIPSWTSFVMQVAAFIILLVIVIFVAYKPVKRILKQRQDYIEKEISDAEKDKADAAINLAQSEETILASKKNASQIIEEAQNQALVRKEEILAEARQQVEKMKLDAQADIARSRQEALDDIHKEIVEVALLTSSEILKREVNDKDNARLAKEFIENL